MATDAQREAAKDAVVAAARELVKVSWWSPQIVTNKLTGEEIDTMPAFNAAVETLASLDALQAEPPEGESAEPELPPRGMAWRGYMSAAMHEDGC